MCIGEILDQNMLSILFHIIFGVLIYLVAIRLLDRAPKEILMKSENLGE